MVNKVLLTMTDDIIHLPHPSHTYTHTRPVIHIHVCVSKNYIIEHNIN